MKWFVNLATRAKLFLVAVILTAYSGLTAIQESLNRLYSEDFANAVDLLDLRSDQNGVRAAVLTMMLLTERPAQEIWYQDVNSPRQRGR